jgi:hypothetical protein
MRRAAIIPAVLLLLLAVELSAAPDAWQQAGTAVATGTLRGRITSGGLGPLPYANVVVAGAKVGTQADSGGRFELRSVPLGAQRILVAALWHAKLDTALTVVAGENPPLHVDLVSRAPAPQCQPCFWVDPHQETRDPAPGAIVLDYTGEAWRALDRGAASALEISSDRDPCELRVMYAFQASVRHARLSVVDSAGRTVHTFLTATSAGRHDLVWNGVDGAGGLTPYGWYRVRLETPRETLELEFVRARRLPVR